MRDWTASPIATGHGFREWIGHDHDLDNLRGLPRFDEIMSRLGNSAAQA